MTSAFSFDAFLFLLDIFIIEKNAAKWYNTCVQRNLSRRTPEMNKTRKHHIHLTLMFWAYMFLHTTTLLLANRESNGIVSAELEVNMYYIHMIFMILGFVLFAVINRFARKGTKVLAAIALFTLAIGIAVLYMIKQEWVFVGIGSMAVFCLGYLGGLVYWRMSAETVSGRRTGLVMGIGCGVAYTLQYFLEGRSISPVLPAVIVLALAALGYVLLFCAETPEIVDNYEHKINVKRSVICAVIIASGFIFFNSFFNGYMHHLQIHSNFEQIDAYAWPRLILVPVYLAFGLLGDIKHGKFVPIAALCAGLAALLHSVLSASEEAQWINMCLFYFTVASAISYYNIIFWNIAPKTRFPELWAPMGRIIDMLAVIILGITKFSSLPATVVLVINIAVLAAIIIVMALNGNFNLHTPQTTPENEPAPPKSEEQLLEAIRMRYSLTPSELKVFRELVLTEDKQAAIGERLSIKISTVQFHTTSIYKKTGAQTRVGLSDIYHKEMNG